MSKTPEPRLRQCLVQRQPEEGGRGVASEGPSDPGSAQVGNRPLR